MSRTKKDNAKAVLNDPDNSPVRRVYSRPALYDLAVGYRDYQEEVQFLLNAHAKFSSKSSRVSGSDGGKKNPSLRILELAAGPARHCVTALKYFGDVDSCTAVDLSTDMVNYSNNEVADVELGKNGDMLRDKFDYVNADMCTIGLETDDKSALKAKSFDCAWILLGSLQHLITNDEVISCFNNCKLA